MLAFAALSLFSVVAGANAAPSAGSNAVGAVYCKLTARVDMKT